MKLNPVRQNNTWTKDQRSKHNLVFLGGPNSKGQRPVRRRVIDIIREQTDTVQDINGTNKKYQPDAAA